MIKKQKWMFKGAIVVVDGKKGFIVNYDETEWNHTYYVHYIDIRFFGEKITKVFFADEVQKFVASRQLWNDFINFVKCFCGWIILPILFIANPSIFGIKETKEPDKP